MNRLVLAYVIYLVLSVAITVCVGRTLHRHGRLFVIDAMHGTVRLAETVNDLLLVGFYLLNVALVLFLLRSPATPKDDLAILEFLADKLAVVLTTLGVMHFINVGLLMCVRCRVWETPTELTTFLD